MSISSTTPTLSNQRSDSAGYRRRIQMTKTARERGIRFDVLRRSCNKYDNLWSCPPTVYRRSSTGHIERERKVFSFCFVHSRTSWPDIIKCRSFSLPPPLVLVPVFPATRRAADVEKGGYFFSNTFIHSSSARDGSFTFNYFYAVYRQPD